MVNTPDRFPENLKKWERLAREFGPYDYEQFLRSVSDPGVRQLARYFFEGGTPSLHHQAKLLAIHEHDVVGMTPEEVDDWFGEVYEGRSNSDGWRAGYCWAMRKSTSRPAVIRMAEHFYTIGTDNEYYFDTTTESAHHPAELFFFAAHPEHEGDRNAAAEFWESNAFMHVRDISEGFLQEFIDGVTAADLNQELEGR